MRMKLFCMSCGKPLETVVPAVPYTERGEIVIDVAVDPCSCKTKEQRPIVMNYDDILQIIQDKVRVTYTKKDGSNRSLVGFLGARHELREDLVYFVEREFESDEAQVKCLIRENIEEIYQLKTGLTVEVQK